MLLSRLLRETHQLWMRRRILLLSRSTRFDDMITASVTATLPTHQHMHFQHRSFSFFKHFQRIKNNNTGWLKETLEDARCFLFLSFLNLRWRLMEFDGCDEVRPLFFFHSFLVHLFQIEGHRWLEERPVFTKSNDEGDVSEETGKYIEVAATHANKSKETLVAKHTTRHKNTKNTFTISPLNFQIFGQT